MPLKNVGDVIDHYGGFSRTALDYTLIVKEVVDSAKQPGFSADSWAPLARLLDTATFRRVGNFKEVMNWTEYATFLTQWAPSADWECSFKRITERGYLVFLELEERSVVGEFSNVVNSLTVYEFNSDGKIIHIDVYLQMVLPPPEMLTSYEGVL